MDSIQGLTSRIIVSALIAAAFTFSGPAFADYDSPEQLIEAGLKDFKNGNALGAIERWTRGGALDNADIAQGQSEALHQLRAHYGEYESHEIVHKHKLSIRSRMLLVVLNLESGAVYGRFQVYRKYSGDWVLTEFRFNVEAARVWPSVQVFGE